MIKHYVEFLYAGCFISESDFKQIDDRNSKINLPKNAYAYRLFDREEVTLDGEVLLGKPKNYSPYHIKGKIYTKQEVRKYIPDHDILLSNMERNGWDRVIKCAQGFLPFGKDYILIE